MTLDTRAAVEVYGIRHHGPGSARSMLAALADFEPDAVLIEGPADADRVLDWVLADGMEPPLALLAYAPERPSVAAFWPFASLLPRVAGDDLGPWPRRRNPLLRPTGRHVVGAAARSSAACSLTTTDTASLTAMAVIILRISTRTRQPSGAPPPTK